MGAKVSKKSVDISVSSPSKKAEENGGVASEEGGVKLEKATENLESVKTANGEALTESQKKNGPESAAEALKVEEATEVVSTPEKVESPDATSPVTSPVTSPDEKSAEDEKTEKSDTPPKPEKKKKTHKIMKTIRSLSFSKKSKPEKTASVTSPSTETEKTEENTNEAKTEEAAALPIIEETVSKVEDKVAETDKKEEKSSEMKPESESSEVKAVVESVAAIVEEKLEATPEAKVESPAVAPIEVPPPLPASPPPSEAATPPATPVAAPETEDLNGGGESLAELTSEVEESSLVNGVHTENGTNGIDELEEEVAPPKSDKVEDELSNKMECLKMQAPDDVHEFIENTNSAELVSASQ